MFDQDDPVSSMNSKEDTAQNVSETNKFEYFNGFDDYVQEARSEEGKEDHKRLDEVSSQSNKNCNFFNQENSDLGDKSKARWNRNSFKQYENKSDDKERNPVKLEEIKQQDLRWDDSNSDMDDNFKSPTNIHVGVQNPYDKADLVLSCFDDRKWEVPVALDSEAKSTKSEESNTRGQIKYVNSTNPTSETNSLKESSVVSNQDNKGRVHNRGNKTSKLKLESENSKKNAPKQTCKQRNLK